MKPTPVTHTCQPEDRIAKFSDDGAMYLLCAADCGGADESWSVVARELRRRQRRDKPGERTGFTRLVAAGGEVVIETRAVAVAEVQEAGNV